MNEDLIQKEQKQVSLEINTKPGDVWFPTIENDLVTLDMYIEEEVPFQHQVTGKTPSSQFVDPVDQTDQTNFVISSANFLYASISVLIMIIVTLFFNISWLYL